MSVTQQAVIGIDVSSQWLDIFCLHDGHTQRVSNDCQGFEVIIQHACDSSARVGFEPTGGLEWPLWQALCAAGIDAQQLPADRIKHFGATKGQKAKTDRIDAKLIAKFMANHPDVGRTLPDEKQRLIRALTSKRTQLVDMRKTLNTQIKSLAKMGLAEHFKQTDEEILITLTKQIKHIEAQIETTLNDHEPFKQDAEILRSIPGIGPVASSTLIAELPELGKISGEQAASLVGLAPITRESGQWKGRSSIMGGRGKLRAVMYQAALVAKNYNPEMMRFAQRLKQAGKPHKVIVTAIARKLVALANALCKRQELWKTQIN